MSNWFKRTPTPQPRSPKPDDADLPKVPPARKWVVEFIDGSAREVWAHSKGSVDGVNHFYRVTGYRWVDLSWRPGSRPWVARINKLLVAEIPNTAVKMIRQG